MTHTCLRVVKESFYLFYTSHIVLYIYAHLKVNGTSIHKFTMTNLLLSIPHTDISKLTRLRVSINIHVIVRFDRDDIINI
jgi:hypothetical protein